MLPVTVSAVHDSSNPPAVLTSWFQHHALGWWLAKHATLCSSIDISVTPETMPKVQDKAPCGNQLAGAYSIMEAYVAAGLEAALNGPSRGPPPRTTRQQAAGVLTLYPSTEAETATATAAAAAAVQAAYAPSSSSGASQPGQALLLTRFVSSMPSSGRVLSTLPACKQLTSVQLRPGAGASVCARAKAAVSGLAALTSLKELGFTSDPKEREVNLQLVHSLAPALPFLTALTHFDLAWYPAQHIVTKLPASLVRLRFGNIGIYSVTISLAHLTQVTSLHIPFVNETMVLPPSLHTLTGHVICARPLLQLQHLQQLQCPLQHWQRIRMPQLQLLTHVVHLSIACDPPLAWENEMSAFKGLITLPLTALTVQTARPEYVGSRPDYSVPLAKPACNPLMAEAIRIVGSCTQLTRLTLQEVRLSFPVAELVLQLKQLPALSELSLVRVHAPWVAAPSPWDPLWRTVPEFVSLRNFVARDIQDDGATCSAGLLAATQLTYCELVGCGVGAAAEAELRAGLTQLRHSMLVVR